MGKPKCTNDAIEAAIKLKKGGANDKDIAAALGVTAETFCRWKNDPKTDKQQQLSQGLKKAEADYKNALVGIILRDASQRDWKAAAWLLERKYPEEYARTDRIQATVEQETKASVRVEHYLDYGEE
jgi:transposase